MATQSTRRPVALVTGASSGLGAAFAARLALDGYDLVVVARRRERLEALSQELEQKYGGRVEVLPADLSHPGVLRAVEQLVAREPALEMLVNNAGFGAYMPFVKLDPDKAEELINLQVLAVTRLTRAALPGMIARGRGSIINVSSRLAFSASLGSSQLAQRATYAASKAFVNAFTQLLHDELEGTGVKVQALCPGVILTEFHKQMRLDTSRFPPDIVSQPEDVVQASLAGLKQGEVICVPNLVDPALLQIRDSERALFQSSGSAAH